MNKLNKKIIVITFFALCGISCFAQNWRVGGNTSAQLAGNPPDVGTIGNDPFNLKTIQAQPINFFTANTPRMVISSTGFIGFGTTAPNSFTHIHNPATGLFQSSFTQWTNPSTTAGVNRGLFVGNLGSTALITQAEASEMIFSTAGSSRVAIRGTAGFNQGFVAIGNSFTDAQHIVDVRTNLTDAGGAINIGNGTPASPQGYMIGDNFVLRHRGESRNIFVGVDAGADNTDPAAIENTFVGNNAGRSNITDGQYFG